MCYFLHSWTFFTHNSNFVSGYWMHIQVSECHFWIKYQSCLQYMVVWKMYYIESKNLVLLKPMSLICFMINLAVIGTDAIWLLSLVCLWMRIIANFLRYIDYLNLIKYHISHLLSSIIVHVLLLSCQQRWLLVTLSLKNHVINTVKQFMWGMVKVIFGM